MTDQSCVTNQYVNQSIFQSINQLIIHTLFLSLRMVKPRIVLIFVSGKVDLTGAKVVLPHFEEFQKNVITDSLSQIVLQFCF